MKVCVRIIFKVTVIRWSRFGRRCIRRIRKRVIARVWWISSSCCCAFTSCGLISRIFCNIIANVLLIFWWTNFRILIIFSTRGFVCWRAISVK